MLQIQRHETGGRVVKALYCNDPVFQLFCRVLAEAFDVFHWQMLEWILNIGYYRFLPITPYVEQVRLDIEH